MTVVLFPGASSREVAIPRADVQTSAPVAPLLDATLAFEALVEALVAFDQRRQVLRAGDIAPLVRGRYRQVLQRALNELDPLVRDAAEARCASAVLRALPAGADRPFAEAFVSDLFADYRRALHQVPLRGVATFF